MKREKTIKAAEEYANSIAQHEHDKNYCIKDFIAGAEWADAHPRWISVDDELPPKESEYEDLSNNVLATDGKEIYESVYNHAFEEWFTHDLWAINNITHWMPMPAPPHHFPDVNKMVSGSSEFPNNCQSVTPRNQSKGGEK